MRPALSSLLITCAVVSAPASVPVDITQLGIASQTHDHGSGLYPASNAVDGDLATFNHTESTGVGGAWELYFPSEKEISRVDITTRDCCGGRLNGATLRLFDAEAEMVFEVDIVDGGPLSTFTADIPPGTAARDLRVGFEPNQPGIVHLAEVNVFGPVGSPPSIDSFAATPDSIASGQSSTLSWHVVNSESVTIRGIGAVAPASGATVVTPDVSTVYVLEAMNDCETRSVTTSVIVDGTPLLPRITEFAAAPSDDRPDWVEIWNPANEPLDLGGHFLTDDPAAPNKYPLDGLTIGAGDLLVIEPGFGLAREAGSYLALVSPDGRAISAFTYPPQSDRATYGSEFDGSPRYFLQPTPGALNHGPTTAGFLTPPSVSVPRGFYDSPFTTELTATAEGSTIHYTTDGSDPSPTGPTSLLYSSPITISGTTVLRAAEFRDGFTPSPIVAHSYLFLEQVVAQTNHQPDFPPEWVPPGTPSFWADEIPALSDYEMDPALTGAAPFTDTNGESFDTRDALLAIPTYSLSMPAAEMFDPQDGLHANSSRRGRLWERPATLEIIDPATGESISTGCGIRIHGGRSRIAEVLKNSFRLYFRGEYGNTKLDHPLFPTIPRGGVDHLVLRAGTGKSWAATWKDRNGLGRIVYVRDQFYRQSHIDMGQTAIGGHFAHLYINGVYWGLYNPVERPGAEFAANQLGGDEDEYDVLKWANANPAVAIDGTIDRWNEILSLSRGNPGDPATWAAIQERVDIDNLIDYMLLNFYAGNVDWVGNNAYAYRRIAEPGTEADKYRILSWDGEETFNSLGQNSTVGGRTRTTNPIEIHDNLRADNADYRLRFADRVHKHLVDEDGVLTTPLAQARWDQVAAQLDRAIVGESARWGDLVDDATPTLTREADWLPEMALLRDTYLVQRPSITLGHLALDDLVSDTATPTIFQTASGFAITAPEGTAWFTTDGSDPMTSPSAQRYDETVTSTAVVNLSSGWRYLDDDSDLSASNWTTAAFDDSAWQSGAAPLGYGTITGAPLATTVSYGENATDKPITTYFRKIFTIADPGEVGDLQIRYLYDDGLVVYLNGTEIERSNLPDGPIDAETTALSSIGGSDESTLHVTDVPSGLLVAGSNVVAVEVHQHRANSSDLAFDLGLFEVTQGIPLTGDSRIKTRAVSGGIWSALDDESYRTLDPMQSLVVSEIMYHPSDPSPAELAAGFTNDDAFEYIELYNVGSGDLLLDGMRFSRGVDVTLSGTLPAGAHGLIVANRAAFEMRYGAGLPIIAEWQSGDRLDNGGERIRLRSHDNRIVRDFVYDDAAPWPTAPDGGGFSLTLVAPATLPNHSLASSWRQSAAPAGSPATHDATTFPGGSSADLLAYASREIRMGAESISIELNPLAEDILGAFEVSTDLETWATVDFGLTLLTVAPLLDGFAQTTYSTSTLPEGSVFLRYRVELR